MLKLSDHATLSKHIKSLIYDTQAMLEPEDVQPEVNADLMLKLHWEVGDCVSALSFKYHDEHTFRTAEQTEQEMLYLL
jgi:hypothetical protein